MREIKRITLITILLLMAVGYSHAQNNTTMRTLDIQKFEENKDRHNSWEYETADSVHVVEKGRGAYYLETVLQKGTTVGMIYSYYKNGNLQYAAKKYYRMNIGKYKVYDQNGNFIQEYDFDEGYTFLITDLRELLLKKFGYDIKDPDTRKYGLRIFRMDKIVNNKRRWYYTVFVPTLGLYEGHNVEIDGETGAILSHFDEDRKDLTKDPEYQKENERYLNPVKKDSLEHRDWTPLVD